MKKLLSKINALLKTSQEPYISGLSPSLRIYCIGDIHGRLDLLQQLHQLIMTDASTYQHAVSVVYVGDYIDRGPHSKQVIDYLLSDPLPDFESIFLLGNHEQVLLEFLENPENTGTWFNFGGLSTLASYDVKFTGIPQRRQLQELGRAFRKKMPETHMKFFQQLLPCYDKEGYYFVHAGVRPGIKLKRQRLEDMLWIRDDFLGNQHFHGKVVVHGHSVSDSPVIRSNRIGVDTGAYSSGMLSCLVLEEKEQRFYRLLAKR